MSMMAGVASACASCDPFADDDAEASQPKGMWVRTVPKGLRALALADVAAFALAVAMRNYECDVPLRTWLLGGILLGYPYSCLVSTIADRRPVMRSFRLTVTRLRGGGDPSDFMLAGVVLYDRYNHPIESDSVQESKDGEYFFLGLSSAAMVRGYRLITHGSAGEETDPVEWAFEGSFDGINWTVIDEVDGADMPTDRGAASPIFDELLHLDNSIGVFRCAFLAEVVGNLLSFAWMMAGTAWVSQGAAVCVDSAPPLWYACYLVGVVVWSFLGTFSTGMIVSAVAMVLLGAKGPPRPGAGAPPAGP